MTKPYRSKALRNLKSATNTTLRTTGNIASKGVNKTAKWMTTDHIGSSHLASMMELQQKINYSDASHNLLMRRLERFDESLSERILGWIADYLHYLWDLLIGFTGPIISMILWSIFRIIVIVACNVIFFYGLYLLLIS